MRRVARNPRGAVNRVAPVLRVGMVLPLKQIIQLYGRTDKLSHGYDRYYVRHLSSRRLSAMRVLEIGVGGYKRPTPGGSLAVWRDYLSRSRIVGLDISDKHVRLGRDPGWGPRPPVDMADVAEVHVYPGILFVIKSETAASPPS